jgi:hypothetical protein
MSFSGQPTGDRPIRLLVGWLESGRVTRIAVRRTVLPARRWPSLRQWGRGPGVRPCRLDRPLRGEGSDLGYLWRDRTGQDSNHLF